MEDKIQRSFIQTYGFKLVCVDDNFSKPFKTYLGKDSVYNFVNSMIKESKSWSGLVKKYFEKELVMTNEDNGNFENSTESWTCDNSYVHDDVKPRDRCHITGKYKGSTHRDCNVNEKLNHKIPVVFHNLKTYDSHFIKQELEQFDLKMNFITNGLEKCMSFKINNGLSLIDSFKFLSFSLDNLVKNLGKDDFKYLSQEFDSNILDLVKQKGC